MGLSREDVARTITPLRSIFWGGLLCILHVSITTRFNDVDYKIDILDDLVGMLLITSGVFKLAAVQVHQRYASAMRFVKAIAVLDTLAAIDGYFVYKKPVPLSALFTLLGIAELIAVVVFCVAMRWLCLDAQLEKSARSWSTTIWLFTLIFLIPLGLFAAASFVMLLQGNSFDVDLGPAGCLLLPVFLAPLIYLFMSTSRMRNEAEVSAAAPAVH